MAAVRKVGETEKSVAYEVVVETPEGRSVVKRVTVAKFLREEERRREAERLARLIVLGEEEKRE